MSLNPAAIQKAVRRLLYAGACVIAGCVQAVAQSAPADSVVFDSATVLAGQPVMLTVRLNNSQSLIALSLPLAYPKTELTLDSLSWVLSRADCAAYGIWEADTATGRVSVTINALAEPYIAPGDGILAQCYFSTNSQVKDTVTAVLDTAFMAPDLPVFARDPEHNDLPLYFAEGMVTIIEPNLPPSLEVSDQQFVNEGEPLAFTVGATDPNGDPVTVSVAGAPTTATFAPLGNGLYEFAWTPEYVGPLSAAGGPFMVTFHGTDGELTTSKTVEIHVSNVNRPPELATVPPISVAARDTVQAAIGAVDPDADPLSFTCLDTVDRDTIFGGNPWTYRWITSNADVGQRTIRLVCTDSYGAADTASLEITVAAAAGHRLTIGQVEGESGGTVEVPVSLFTRDSIGGADLLIHYDPTALTFNGTTRTGHAAASWELFNISAANDPGGRSVHVVGIVDLDNGTHTPPLPPSDTVLFMLLFSLSDQSAFYDQSIPLTFNLASSTDNVLSDQSGTLIAQNDIDYVSGAVLIRKPAGLLIGDINLNGVAFEIGDAVRLTNYFIYGQRAALNPVQMANADCNQDGMKATISDLVYLIRVLIERSTK